MSRDLMHAVEVEHVDSEVIELEGQDRRVRKRYSMKMAVGTLVHFTEPAYSPRAPRVRFEQDGLRVVIRAEQETGARELLAESLQERLIARRDRRSARSKELPGRGLKRDPMRTRNEVDGDGSLLTVGPRRCIRPPARRENRSDSSGDHHRITAIYVRRATCRRGGRLGSCLRTNSEFRK